MVKNPSASLEDDSWIPELGIYTLKKQIATHSSILVWRMLWTEEPGGLIVHVAAKSRTQLSD